MPWGALAAAAVPFIADKIFGGDDDKVPGVPTPSELGKQQAEYFDGAYPGTTPWERLGATSNMSGMQNADFTKQTEMKMQSRELQNRSQVARYNARAQVIAALGGVSPIAARSAVDLLESGSGEDYDTNTRQGRDRMPSEVGKNEAAARYDRAGASETEARLPYAKSKAKAELLTERVRPYTMATDSGSRLLSSVNPLGLGLNSLKGFLRNNKSRPSRFDTGYY